MGKSLDIIKAPRRQPAAPAKALDQQREKNQDDFFAHEAPTKDDPLLFYLILGLCAIILLIILSVALIYKTLRSPASDTVTPTDTTTEEVADANTIDTTANTATEETTAEAAETTATATPAIDKAALKLRVLNGNGRTGEAALVAQTLKDAGFTNVSTGNTLSRYKSTIIYHKAGKVAEAQAVQTVVAAKYQNISLLEDESIVKDNDVVVALGN